MRVDGSITSLAVAVAVALSSAPAFAQAENGPPTPQQRAAMMRKIHTGFVLEMGEILDLDTNGTLKLGERLQSFDDQRIQLRLDNAEAIRQLRDAARSGTSLPNAADLARRIAQNRVQLAQIDQAELQEALKGVPADKVAKIAVFISEYPRRIEHMARELHRDQWMKRHGPSPEED